MRFESETMKLPSPIGVGVGQSHVVDRMSDHTFQVAGTFVATLDVEASDDGINWAPVVVGITSPGISFFGGTVRLLRVAVRAYTSGSPAVTYAAFDNRVT